MIRKQEVEKQKLLVVELNYFAEDKSRIEFSDSFPPELSGLIAGVGAGGLSIAGVITWLSGMSGAQIMASIASYSIRRGSWGHSEYCGYSCFASCCSGWWSICCCQSAKAKEIQYLFILIADLKEQLKEDSRENVSKLLAVIDQLILDIEKKHKV